MGIIGLQALVTLVFLLFLLENNCHGSRSLHYCANWSPSPYDGIGRYIYLTGSPPDDGYAYRDDDQSSGTHPCRSVRIDNRMGHYFSVSGFPSEECADWMPGYDGKKGHYEHKKGTPPKVNRSRLMRNSCWVYKFSSSDGYYISEGGETPREDTCALTGPQNSTGHYIWTHASYEYCADWEPGYDGREGSYNWHKGPTPQEADLPFGYTAKNVSSFYQKNVDDPCVRYAGNEKPGQNGTGGYYRWEHGYVASPTAKDCASWEPGYDGSEGHYTSVNDSDDKCILVHPDEKGYYIWNHFELPKCTPSHM
uniref:Secreted protein n=1 Tax=Glossina austeni TaxID=7395 RepID=A0A1A9VGI8_GLOAU